MKVSITSGDIKGIVSAPPSKSAMQRACALSLLHEGKTILRNPGISNDDKAALDIIRQLGATVEVQYDGHLIVTGTKTPQANEIFCGESGLSIRMFTPIAALSSAQISITGSGSLLTRPLHFFDEVLPLLGVDVVSNNGHLPIKVKGPLQATAVTIDGSLSSQFLTGLLIAFANAATKPVVISVKDLKSKPYIGLTLQMMAHFGYMVVNDNYETFTVTPGNHLKNKMINYKVEGDWSGAAFLLVAGAIGGSEVLIHGLNLASEQADKVILDVVKMAGAIVSESESRISVCAGELSCFSVDATDCPDLFPPLAVLAACCAGISKIKGVSRLAHKESDRGVAICEEFKKMGIRVELEGDEMSVHGGMLISGAKVHSHHDHRIAMAMALLGTRATGETVIEDAEAINKSYPGFYQDLQELGVGIEMKA